MSDRHATRTSGCFGSRIPRPGCEKSQYCIPRHTCPEVLRAAGPTQAAGLSCIRSSRMGRQRCTACSSRRALKWSRGYRRVKRLRGSSSGQYDPDGRRDGGAARGLDHAGTRRGRPLHGLAVSCPPANIAGRRAQLHRRISLRPPRCQRAASHVRTARVEKGVGT